MTLPPFLGDRPSHFLGFSSRRSRASEIVGAGCEHGLVTTVEEDRTQVHIHGLLQALRDAEADFRRSYSRVLGVVAELAQQNAGAATGFGNTARLLAGVKV